LRHPGWHCSGLPPRHRVARTPRRSPHRSRV